MSLVMNGMAAATSEKQDPMDMAACRRAVGILFKHYPGHEWLVDIAGGVMNIRSANLSSNYGWVQRLDEVTPRNFDNKVMKGGGEILERFGMPAQKMDIQIWKDLPRDLRGIPEKDLS